VITEVVTQGSLDAWLEEGHGRQIGLKATGSTDQLKASHLLGIIPIDQIRKAAVKAAGEDISEGEELVDDGIAGGLGAGHGPDGEGRATPGPDEGGGQAEQGRDEGCGRPHPAMSVPLVPPPLGCLLLRRFLAAG
jgi:hypothetical protein